MSVKIFVGYQYECWTVIGGPVLLSNSGCRRASFWQCRCKCGTLRNVREGSLHRKKTKSCGCLRYFKIHHSGNPSPKKENEKKEPNLEIGMHITRADYEWMNKWRDHSKKKRITVNV